MLQNQVLSTLNDVQYVSLYNTVCDGVVRCCDCTCTLYAIAERVRASFVCSCGRAAVLELLTDELEPRVKHFECVDHPDRLNRPDRYRTSKTVKIAPEVRVYA